MILVHGQTEASMEPRQCLLFFYNPFSTKVKTSEPCVTYQGSALDYHRNTNKFYTGPSFSGVRGNCFVVLLHSLMLGRRNFD